MRIFGSFLAAPLVAPVVVALMLWGSGDPVPFPGFYVAAGAVAYLCTFVLGVPALLMFQAWGVRSMSAYLAGGSFLGLFPAALLGFLLESAWLAFAVVLAAAVEAVVFRAIRGGESNIALEPTG